jgi:hypothetical protein
MDAEKIGIYKGLRMLGISRSEAGYYLKKTYSFLGVISNKDLDIPELIYGKENKITNSKKEKRKITEKLREIFPEGEIIYRMDKLEIPRKKIEEYFENTDFFKGKKEREYLENAVGDLYDGGRGKAKGKDAINSIDRLLLDYKNPKRFEKRF